MSGAFYCVTPEMVACFGIIHTHCRGHWRESLFAVPVLATVAADVVRSHPNRTDYSSIRHWRDAGYAGWRRDPLGGQPQNGHARIQLRVLGQTLQSSDPAEGRGTYSSTFDAPGGVRVLAARRTVLQHGETITLDQTGPLKKMVSLTLPLYHGQKP